MGFFLKDPQSRVDYAIDWAPGYLDGQALAAARWSVFPAEAGGIAIEEHGFDLTRTAATLSGGLVGHVYSVVAQVTLSDGRRDQRSITLRVEER
jgi:hypothetical protein